MGTHFLMGNKSMTIPKGVQKIGDLAFKNCKCLTRVQIPEWRMMRMFGNGRKKRETENDTGPRTEPFTEPLNLSFRNGPASSAGLRRPASVSLSEGCP